MENNLGRIHTFTQEYNIWLSQDQFDATILHYYLRPRAIVHVDSEVNSLLIEMFNEPNAANDPNLESMYRDRLRDAMINEMRTEMPISWQINGRGWTNRVNDTMEMFFEGDAVRNH